jgi:hypothetical protein
VVGKSRVSGYQFYEWYLDEWNQRGGYYSHFAIWDLMAEVLYGEWYENPQFAPAAANAAAGWCYEMGGTGCTATVDIVNWFAAYHQTAGAYFHNSLPLPGERIISSGLYGIVQQALGLLQQLPLLFSAVNPPDIPFGYANDFKHSGEVQEWLAAHTENLYGYIGVMGRAHFIPTWCVWKHWLDEGNLAWSCPTVR